MKYGLKVSEREVLNFEMTDIGTLFHSVLEKYPKALEKRNTTWVDATLEQQTESIKEAVEVAFEKQNKTPYGLGRMRYTKAQVEKMSTRAIEALTYQLKQGEFEPVAYELTFGKNGFLPIEIALNDTQSLLIQGQIDRIDVYQKENERYVKIMDYKSGSQEFSLVEVYYGLQLQLLLYLDAYLKLNEGDLPAGVFYFHISGSTISYKANMTEEEIESKRQKNYKLSGLLLEDVEIAKKMEQEVMGEVIPATLKKESKSKKQQEPTFTATSSVASMAQFTVLRNHMVEILKSLGQEILSGRIVAKPYQYGTYTSCKYCDYLSVCQFDETQADNQVENLSKLKDKEVWQKLMPQEGGTADGMDDSATSGD
jgi:ATP-dependent helicase/nuclease subunit B